ncbi:MAG: CotS family spore coat protein [Acetivibrio sp.]
MDERLEEVLGKYDFKVRQVTRVRGALCLDTDKGIRLLKSGGAAKRRIEFEDQITKMLVDKGCKNVDYLVPSREGTLITEDSQGESYVVKQWFSGEECRVKEKEDLILAVGNLAQLHTHLILKKEEPGEIKEPEEGMMQIMERHNREIKRVGSYIRGKKQKNDFERCILKSFDEFHQRAEVGLELLKQSNLLELEEMAKKSGQLRHGSYTYHNVLLCKEKIATVNFEKADFGLPLLDVYYFLRKVMEKNAWRVPLGDKLIREYMCYHGLDKESLNLLGTLLYYPEKYWKILNHYYNNKKSWIPQKDMEKLELVCEQDRQKLLFLQQLFGLSF